MITPQIQEGIGEEINETTLPSRTYHLDIHNDRISGIIDGREAIKQSVYKILQTERYEHLIYDWDYGREFNNMIGKDYDYIKNDIERVIKEALLTDERILEVTDFSSTIEKVAEKNNVLVSFTVISVEGSFNMEVIANV